MKLLCDVCENAVASLICCADEAALCFSCDSNVHAANKLASKHHRMPLCSEASGPVVCDICQERPSFFFCMEDRALLCRECDVSIHSTNTLAAKHRRFLLTGIQVGVSSNSSPSPEGASAISLEPRILGTSPSPPTSVDVAAKQPYKQAVSTAVMKCSNNTGGFHNLGEMGNQAAKKPCKQPAAMTTTSNPSKGIGGVHNMVIVAAGKEAFSPEKAHKASDQQGMNVESRRSYTMNKQGTLSMPDSADQRKTASDKSGSNSTTISIQRISVGRVPFVAPVLRTLRPVPLQEEVSNNVYDNKNMKINNIKDDTSNNVNNNNSNSVMMDVDGCPPTQSDDVLDYLTSGIPGWRFDELLTDLVGMYEGAPSLSPPKESNAPGFGIQGDPLWDADLDFMEEHELSPSQEEGMALVPEMPSPPTASGLVTSHGKPSCPVAQPWSFDYLFSDHHPSDEFSVVPDIDGHRSSPISTASPTRDRSKKKRKVWLDV